MRVLRTPSIKQLLAQAGDEFVWAQTVVLRVGEGFEVRHVEDRSRLRAELRTLRPPEVRQLAQFRAGGEFRPLKSAPNLPSGWRVEAHGETELELILNHLYPGSVADW